MKTKRFVFWFRSLLSSLYVPRLTPAPRRRSRRPCGFESLETRAVFAAYGITGTTLNIDLDQTDEVAYLYNDGTSLRLNSSHLASEVSFDTAAVTSIQVTDTTNKTGQSFSLSYGLPMSLSGSMSVSQIETVVFGGDLTVSGSSGLSVTASESIQVRAPLSTTGDPIVFRARNGITITHPVITNGGNQTFDADNDANGVGTVTLDFPLKEFTDPNPNPGNGFGSGNLVLPSGNVVITSPNDDAGGTDAGAVYLFNGMTGSLISTLRGSSASDQVGSTGLVQLTNGNYVVRSSTWDSGTITDVGAVTWGSGVLGVSGVVSSSNSLVGSTAGDQVGLNSVTVLTNRNYVVTSSNWDSGAITNVGAVTWGNGTSGISGVVSSSNSIVGQTANTGSSWAITNASNLDAFLASNSSDGSGRVVLGSSARGFSLPSTSQITSIQVSKGQTQRTYLRYIDLTMVNASVATQLASNASTRMKLVKRDLNGNNPSDMSLTGLVSASGSTVAIDFGAQGIGGARNTNAADGYYALQFDLDSDGTFETTYNFFRLFGDTNGDGKVDQTDVNNVTAGMTAYSAEYDLNLDGRVTSGDLILVRRALGRALNTSLPLG